MKLIQKPNLPLSIAIVAFLIKTLFRQGPIHHLGAVGLTISLVIWSYLEVTEGANWFRKILGGIVLASNLFFLFNNLRT